ncbi:zinc c3hc4 type (ring finger) domain-containing protein [Cystoisospora suis]|uniref:RING-type E3 ubiquitin transferase n=1 Tax=Cystoisospora suis TaxID=483139 RepID=A0A2C6KFC2_9APIC|nr:zinc c3hc4 type (ring finger) domain-containing protein [Cystoisospora suis]
MAATAAHTAQRKTPPFRAAAPRQPASLQQRQHTQHARWICYLREPQQLDLVRATQKDDYYFHQLVEQLFWLARPAHTVLTHGAALVRHRNDEAVTDVPALELGGGSHSPTSQTRAPSIRLEEAVGHSPSEPPRGGAIAPLACASSGAHGHRGGVAQHSQNGQRPLKQKSRFPSEVERGAADDGVLSNSPCGCESSSNGAHVAPEWFRVGCSEMRLSFVPAVLSVRRLASLFRDRIKQAGREGQLRLRDFGRRAWSCFSFPSVSAIVAVLTEGAFSLTDACEHLVRRYGICTEAALSLAYFWCCYARRGQSLGEEYCNLLLVKKESPGNRTRSYVRLPSGSTMLGITALRTLSIPVITLLLRAISRRCGGAGTKIFGTLLTAARRVHLAIFFWNATHLHISTRVTGFRFASFATRSRQPSQSEGPCRLLSLLLGLQALASLRELVAAHELWKASQAQKPARGLWIRREGQADKDNRNNLKPDLPVTSQRGLQESTGVGLRLYPAAGLESCATDRIKQKDPGLAGCRRDEHGGEEMGTAVTSCLFCQNKCVCPTATSCGHIYCWTCIVRWIHQQEDEYLVAVCPVCRSPCPPQELVPLRHYKEISHSSHETAGT